MAVVARITASKALEAARFVESDSAGAYVHNHLARDYSTWRPPRTWTGYGEQYAQGRSTIVVAPNPWGRLDYMWRVVGMDLDGILANAKQWRARIGGVR